MAVVTGSTLLGVVLNYPGALATGITQAIAVNLPSGQSPTQFANGTGAQQLTQLAVAASRSLSISTPVTDDLTALTTAYIGTATDFTATGVKVFAVTNNEALGSGRNLIFGGGASNPWVGKLGGTTPTWTIKPGETLLFVDFTSTGMPVTGSIKSFKLDPGANPVNCTITIAG